MPEFYLRLEGVNLAGALDDTTHISVVRGAGLLLLKAPTDPAVHPSDVTLEPISTGASEGFYRFSAENPGQARDIRDQVADNLSTHALYRHFTFVVDLEPATDDFARDRKRLLARSRFRQMAQWDLALPDPNTEPSCNPCPIDGVRPADATAHLPDQPGDTPVSASVSARLSYGRRARQGFYRDILGRPAGKFTDDTGQLTADPDGLHGNLGGKLGLLYIDGNGFGKIARSCGVPAELNRWDSDLKGLRRGWLRRFLEDTENDPGFHDTSGRRRLEILKWGGDELMIVVPAWRALWTLGHYFAHHWRYDNQPLTHAAGLVLAHHKTPIDRLRHLGEELAEGVKRALGDTPRDAFDYLVLESVDFPSIPVGEFRRRHYGRSAIYRPCCLPSIPEGRLNELGEWVDRLPHRQVLNLAMGARAGATAFTSQAHRFSGVVDFRTRRAAARHLSASFGMPACDPWCWILLHELWDYLDRAYTHPEGYRHA